MIYLDNAATTYQKPEAVIKAVAEAVGHMGNAGRGVHGASLDSSRMVYSVRKNLAEFFGAGGPEQVAFTANSTQALNMAIQGLFGPGDQVIATACDHNSVLRPLYLMEQRGVRLRILPADSKGRIRYGQMEAWMEEQKAAGEAEDVREVEAVRAVVCTHASNLTGNVLDIGRIGSLCRKHGCLLVVDASQTAGTFPIHMENMGIDVLCFTGHKGMMGPQGIGGICVRKGLKIRPLIVGGSGIRSYQKAHPEDMPAALEAGTLNGPGIAGLGAALEFIRQQGQDRLRAREQRLMGRFYEGVSAIPGIRIYGDFGEEDRAPIVALNLRGWDSGELSDVLDREYGIAVRAGAHCAPLMHRALGTEDQGAVRFSFSWFNTEGDIDTAVRALAELAAGEEKEDSE